MQDEQQAWIDETLSALDGMQRASAPTGFHSRVMARIGVVRRITLRGPMVWLAAAGFLLLVGLNGYALLHHRGGEGLSRADVRRDGRPDGVQGGGNPLVVEYFAPMSLL